MQAFVRLLKRIHKSYSVEKEASEKIHVVQREIDKDSNDYQSELCMARSLAAQNREKQEWAKEKPKLDGARKLRGIYFINPDDKEFSEIFTSQKKKTQEENWKDLWHEPCPASETISI